MKCLFICPSNLNLMPYLHYYESNVDVECCEYLIWDRLGEESRIRKRHHIYRDKKYGLSRSFLDYVCFAFFCLKLLLKNEYDRLVIFGPQLTFFLSIYLFFTRTNYVIDYRDYHRTTNLIPSHIFKKAKFVAISSPGFFSRIGQSSCVVLCHNYSPVNDEQIVLKAKNTLIVTKDTKLSCIGAIRDLQANLLIIDSLSNSSFKLNFHGFSEIAELLNLHCDHNNVHNCIFTGRYERSEELNLYLNAGLINLLRLPDSYNNIVALPNRVYNCAKYRRPAVCFEGTELADLVRKYSLGVVLPVSHSLESVLNDYITNFDYDVFFDGCEKFLADIEEEQMNFYKKLNNFYQG